MYSISYSKDAAKTLLKLPRNIGQLLRKKIEGLALDPFAPNSNVKALKGTPAYRLRVGDWRIIYEVHEHDLRIAIIKIGPRGDIYK